MRSIRRSHAKNVAPAPTVTNAPRPATTLTGCPRPTSPIVASAASVAAKPHVVLACVCELDQLPARDGIANMPCDVTPKKSMPSAPRATDAPTTSELSGAIGGARGDGASPHGSAERAIECAGGGADEPAALGAADDEAETDGAADAKAEVAGVVAIGTGAAPPAGAGPPHAAPAISAIERERKRVRM